MVTTMEGRAGGIPLATRANLIMEIRDNAYEDAVFYNTSPYNLTGGYTKGSTSVTTVSNNSWCCCSWFSPSSTSVNASGPN